jgi:hypothetical protein
MKRILSASLFALVAAAAAHGQTIYSTRAAYDLAHPVNAVIDFNSFGPDGTFYPSGLTASTPFGNVSFTGTPSTATAIETLSATHFGFASPANDNNFVLHDNGGQFLTDSLLITLPANSFSFGTDLISPSATVPEPYKFTIYSGSTVLATEVSPSVSGSYTFFGFDSLSTPITSIAIQLTNVLGNPEPVLDNFTVVTEPGTWIGAALTLLFIGYTQRRKLVPALKRFTAALPTALPPG